MEPKTLQGVFQHLNREWVDFIIIRHSRGPALPGLKMCFKKSVASFAEILG